MADAGILLKYYVPFAKFGQHSQLNPFQSLVFTVLKLLITYMKCLGRSCTFCICN